MTITNLTEALTHMAEGLRQVGMPHIGHYHPSNAAGVLDEAVQMLQSLASEATMRSLTGTPAVIAADVPKATGNGEYPAQYIHDIGQYSDDPQLGRAINEIGMSLHEQLCVIADLIRAQ